MITDKTISMHLVKSQQPDAEKVSAVIITYNEERIIAKTLERLGWCDEIVIIDSGSTDSTVDICKEFGCVVYTRPFNGFGEQKKFGVSKAKNDWILCIDADEVLTEPLIDEIIKELSKGEINYAGYAMRINLVFMNRIFRFGKEANFTNIRLFDRKRGNWDGAVVHENLVLQGAVKKLTHRILHYSYRDYNQFLEKINLYSDLGANKLFDKKSKKNKLVVLLALPFNFFKYYLLDRNFLNGFHGFTWSLFNTIYHFLKYVKLFEMQEREKEAISNRQ